MKYLYIMCCLFLFQNTFGQKNIDSTKTHTASTEEAVFEDVEVMPEFPGGQGQMMRFITQNVEYPQMAIENGIQGRVIIRFVVTSTGEVKNAKVLKGIHPSLDKEALRVVKKLPKFKPGIQKGKAVSTYYTLPISFKLA